MENLKDRRLWVMCGIPGSGKSTFIATHDNFFNERKAVISRDNIRFSMIKEGDSYFSKEKEVFAEFIRQIKESLNKNVDTIVDATHINPPSRGKLLRALGDSLKKTQVNAIVIKVPLDVALERNKLRDGLKVVPDSAIINMDAQYSNPTLEEGFDNIWIREGETYLYHKPVWKIIRKEDT